MFGSILFTVLFMLGGGFPLFTLAWVGNRLVQSLGWAGMVKVTSRWFSYTTYGSVMAVLSLSYLFGDAISRAIMSLLLAHGFGWRGIFAAGAGLLSVIFLGNLIFLRESPVSYNLPAPEENPLNLFSGSNVETGVAAIFRTFLSSYAFWLVCGLSLGTTLLRETFNLLITTYFTQMAGMTSAQAANGSALFSVLWRSVCFVGRLSQRLPRPGGPQPPAAGRKSSLTVPALLGLAEMSRHAPRFLPLSLVAAVAFCLLGPYSYLAGAMALDFGGKEGSGTASGMIDGFGYFAGILSGNGMAHLAVNYGWDNVSSTCRRRGTHQRCRCSRALAAASPCARDWLAASGGGGMIVKTVENDVSEVECKPGELTLTWQNSTYSVYSALWLRDNDPANRDALTGRRLVSVADLPLEPRLQSAETQPPGNLTLRWEDGATSVFPLRWLRAFRPRPAHRFAAYSHAVDGPVSRGLCQLRLRGVDRKPGQPGRLALRCGTRRFGFPSRRAH